MKKVLMLLLSLLLLLCACTPDSELNGGESTETGEGEGEGLFPEGFAPEDYEGNPHMEELAIVDEGVLRIRFSRPVRPGAGLYAGELIYRVEGETLDVKDCRLYGIVKDRAGYAYGSVVDLLFDQAVTEGGVLAHAAPEGDAVTHPRLFVGIDGSGMMFDKGETAKVKKGEIPLPKERARLVSARVIDAKTGEMEMTFNTPVTDLLDWTSIVFVSDTQYPDPGVNGSWQFTVRDVRAMDPIQKKNREYAGVYRFHINLNGMTLPEQGVVRVMENDAKAPEELGSATDDDTLGRVCIDLRGEGVQADDCAGWDVCYAPYTWS